MTEQELQLESNRVRKATEISSKIATLKVEYRTIERSTMFTTTVMDVRYFDGNPEQSKSCCEAKDVHATVKRMLLESLDKRIVQLQKQFAEI